MYEKYEKTYLQKNKNLISFKYEKYDWSDKTCLDYLIKVMLKG